MCGCVTTAAANSNICWQCGPNICNDIQSDAPNKIHYPRLEGWFPWRHQPSKLHCHHLACHLGKSVGISKCIRFLKYFSQSLIEALLTKGDFNVIDVHWDGGASAFYFQAGANTRLVSLEIALLVNTMVVRSISSVTFSNIS